MIENAIEKCKLSEQQAEAIRISQEPSKTMHLIASELMAQESTRYVGIQLEQTAQLLRPHRSSTFKFVIKAWEHISDAELNKPIKMIKSEEVPHKPVSLPEGLKWDEMDLKDES